MFAVHIFYVPFNFKKNDSYKKKYRNFPEFYFELYITKVSNSNLFSFRVTKGSSKFCQVFQANYHTIKQVRSLKIIEELQFHSSPVIEIVPPLACSVLFLSFKIISHYLKNRTSHGSILLA